MKNRNLMHVSLVAMVLALGIAGCKPGENANPATTTTVTATPEPTPDTNAIVAEITRIENDWPRIIRERDGAAVRRVEADDVMLVYPDGSAGNKEQDIKDIEAGMITFDSWEMSELKVNVIDGDTAVASLLIAVTNGKLKTPDGKTQDISGKYRAIDTFVRRNGQWQLVASAATPLSRSAAAAASASPTPQGSPAAKASPTRRTPPPPPRPAATP